MATFILVHGAWGGGWHWKWVAPYLRVAGHTVYTPSLTGMGDRAHLISPAVDLDTHILDVANLLQYEDLQDVVLVGWSYGGMPVTGAADRVPERIAHIVFLDSDIPRDGDTSVPPGQIAAREAMAWEQGYGWFVPPRPDIWDGYLGRWLPEDMRQWIFARLTPHPLRTWTQPIRLMNPKLATIPCTYIRCTVDVDETTEDTIRQNERIRAETSWRYRELETNHFAPFTEPRATADLLLEAAGQSRP